MVVTSMTEIFDLFMVHLCQHLMPHDLARLACVSHELNELVTPYLYRTVRFHSPGRIAADDQLLLQLDIFGDPRFDKLVYTRRVIVSGSWYEMYSNIDSDLGPHHLLSPAARMLSNIITNCIVRMPNLEEFIWDMQLSLTQLLLTTVMLRQGLTSLRLRMGTNSTPKPFFRPPLNLHTIINLRVMHLIDVDDVSVLKSLGLALQASAQLEQLSIWADHQSQLSVDTLFKQWHEPAPFRLRSLDIRGFFDIGTSAKRFWAAIPPTKLRELTLQLGPHFLMQDSADFWDASIQAELRPAQLASNLGATGLQDFLMSFSGLEAFQLLPSDMPRPMEPMRALMNALESHHFASLRVLGLSPFRCEARYMLDVSNLTFLVGALPNIEEFRFSLPGFNAELIETALLLPRLRVVQIDPVHDDSRMQSRFSKFILHLLHKGVARNLTYIAFDDADVREIFRDPIHMSNKISLVGYVDGTVLLKEKALDWVRPYF